MYETQEKRFLREGKQIIITLHQHPSSTMLSSVYKHDMRNPPDKRLARVQAQFGKKLFDKCIGYDHALQIHSTLKPVQEKEYGEVLKLKSKAPKINLRNPINPIWTKLKQAHAPKEDGDSYIFDEKSAGIHTPVLEGIARMNPRAPTKYGYIKLINDLKSQHESFAKKNKFEDALRALTRAWLYCEIACHVAYYSNAKKENVKMSEIVDNLFKYNDGKLIEEREKLMKSLKEYKGILRKRNKEAIIEKIESEFVLFESPDKQPRREVKVVKKDIVDRLKEAKKRLEDNLEEYPKLDEDIERLQKFLDSSRSSDVKGNVQNDIEKLKEKRDRIKKLIDEDKKLLSQSKESIGEVKEETETVKEQGSLFNL